MNARVLLMGVLALLVLAVPVRAQDAQVPEALLKLKADGGTIDFLGHAYGLDGWRVLAKDGQEPRYAYTTKEGGLLLGVLLSPDGKSVTGEQLRALKDKREGGQGAAPGAENASAADLKVEKIYARIEKAGWISVGDATAPYMYVFMNVFCDHCQAYWNELLPAIRGGRLQVRLVPFGRQAENRNAGAALLSVDDAGVAWSALIAGDKSALSADKIKGDMLARIDANGDLLHEMKVTGDPPYTVYRRPADGRIIAVLGRPANTMLVMSDVMGKE